MFAQSKKEAQIGAIQRVCGENWQQFAAPIKCMVQILAPESRSRGNDRVAGEIGAD